MAIPAFGTGGSFFGSFDWVMLKNIELKALMGTFYQYIHVAFRGSFACITVGLIVGALAERIPFLRGTDLRGGVDDTLPTCRLRIWFGAAVCWRPMARWTSPAAPLCTSTPRSPGWSAPI